MLGALLAVVAVTIVITATPVVLAQGSQQKYADDAIVRDLKAGKLNVRQAQSLQARRDRAATNAAVSTPRRNKAHPAVSRAAGGKSKAMRGAKSRNKTSGAPIRHLTVPHGKRQPARHVKTEHKRVSQSLSHRHGKLVKARKTEKKRQAKSVRKQPHGSTMPG